MNNIRLSQDDNTESYVSLPRMLTNEKDNMYRLRKRTLVRNQMKVMFIQNYLSDLNGQKLVGSSRNGRFDDGSNQVLRSI